MATAPRTTTTPTTTTSRLLMRVLDEPDLVPAVQALPSATLRALIGAVGIEDSAALLAAATPEQITDLVDATLWQADGAHETFDDRGFVTWLEVMFEGGDALVARRLVDLPEATVVNALHRQLLVLDVQTMGMGMAGASQHEAALAAKALDAVLYLEFSDYTLVCRDSLGWDTVIAALLAVDSRDHAWVERILDACRRASTEIIRDNGDLYDVLTSDEMLDQDALADRESRRAPQGYVSAADASAFLRWAGQPKSGVPDRDAVTAAYFRTLQPTPAPTTRSSLMPLLRQYGVVPGARPLAVGSSEPSPLRDGLASLSDAVQQRRQSELAYLANVLVAAGQGHTPVDAAHEVIRICDAGLAQLLGAGRTAESVLAQTTCDQLFALAYAHAGAAKKRG